MKETPGHLILNENFIKKYIMSDTISRRSERKRKLTRSSSSEAELFEFNDSTSSFRSKEEKALNIIIQDVTNIEDIFDFHDEILPSLFEFVLPDFGYKEIISFNPEEHRHSLSKNQIKFMYKLKLILINNNPDSEARACERFVDDFVRYLYEMAEMDDGIDLIMRPCNLYLQILDESFAAIADLEGRRGTEIIWILCEDKHSRTSSYKHGDIQLASGIIAAFQANYNLLGKIHPEKIIGIKVIADSFYFCSIKMNDSYMEQLFEGLPNDEIQMKKYPKNGICISDKNERIRLLKYLSSLRVHALNLST